jgi:hypothetical protein
MDSAAPTRVHYFAGQYLDAADLTEEQDYHRGKHQRLSRLAVGSGVLCGLEVSATGDGQVVVEPGIAIDPLGREIVLTAAHVLADPFRPTGDDGQPSGSPVRGGPVTLYARYAERGIVAEPVVVGGSRDQDAPPDRIVETYRIVVREGDLSRDAGLSAAQADAFLPALPGRSFDRRAALRGALDHSCRMHDDAGVVLASVRRSRGGRGIIVDMSRRRDLYSAAQLLDLVLSLADRLSAIERASSA